MTGSRPENAVRPQAVADESGGWGEGSEVSAEDVLELVRMRAARERQELAGESSRLPQSGELPADRDGFGPSWTWPSPGPEELPRTPGDVAPFCSCVAYRRPALRPVVERLYASAINARDLLGRPGRLRIGRFARDDPVAASESLEERSAQPRSYGRSVVAAPACSQRPAASRREGSRTTLPGRAR